MKNLYRSTTISLENRLTFFIVQVILLAQYVFKNVYILKQGTRDNVFPH